MSANRKLLKINFLLFILCSFYLIWQCGGKTDSKPKTESDNLPRHHYKLNWNANPESDVSHYLLYAWHGEDTLSAPFIDNTGAGHYSQYFVKKVPHSSTDTMIRDTVEYIANGDWLQFAITAVNKSGGVSPIGISNFIRSEVPDSIAIP
jgi:hypothetical protein